MSRFRIVPAFAVALILAACGESASDPLGPDGPRMNNGLIMGGNRTGSDSTAAAPGATTYSAGTPSTDDGQTPPEDNPPPKEDTGGLVMGGN